MSHLKSYLASFPFSKQQVKLNQYPAAMAMKMMAKMMKKCPKKVKKTMKKKFTHFNTTEKDCLRRLQNAGKSPSEVALLLDRDLSAVNRHFQRNAQPAKATKPVGHPPALTEKQVDRVVERVEHMTQAAGKSRRPYQVTAGMVRKSLKLKCKDPVVLAALRKRGVSSHKMREKPLLTEDDEKSREQFGTKYSRKKEAFWAGALGPKKKSVQGYLDNKFFPAYLTGRARTYAAKRAVHRTFRKRGQGLDKAHVKPRKATSGTFGSKSVLVAVAISARKVLMCHVVPGKWSGSAAATMYSSSLGPALRKTYPSKKRFVVLEDNDPSGYKAKVAMEAKRKANIISFEIPKRSPDLNPLDYGFWDAVNRRLRAQEKRFAYDKRESHQQFVARLRRTILRIPKTVLAPLVKNMKRRCAAVKKAEGAHFEESPPRKKK